VSASVTLGHLRGFVAARPRLFAAVLGSAVVFALLPGTMALPIRFVIAWDIGAAAYICMTVTMMARSPHRLRYRAQIEDASKWAILALMIAAALASLLSIAFVLHEAKNQTGWVADEHVLIAGGTILLSWGFAHLLFAIHYAHAFYDDSPTAHDPKAVARGLEFPGEKDPDYWDFLYFSFVVGMTCQVSDVQVTGRLMRRLTLGHGIIAFLFNTVILALSINLLAGLL
jgi:uncharacterized membrane protein